MINLVMLLNMDVHVDCILACWGEVVGFDVGVDMLVVRDAAAAEVQC